MAQLDDQPATATAVVSPPVDGKVVVTLSGELDLSTVGPVEAQIRTALRDDTKGVVFDVANLTFMDSSGIAMLLRIADVTHQVEIRNPSVVIRQMIRATGLSDVLRVDDE